MGVNPFRLRDIKAGMKVSAAEARYIKQLLNRKITASGGINLKETSTGWHLSGALGGSGGKPKMVICVDAMVADDTEYTAKYLEADGTEGTEIELRRPNGVYVAAAEVGWLGVDSSGQPIFITGRDPMMIKAQADMTADDTAYSAKFLEADGTEGATISVRRSNGIIVHDDDVGFLGRDSSGQPMFIHAHTMPVVPLDTDSVGVLTEGAEAADTDVYNATTSIKGCALDIMTRVAYFHAGDETLYGYTRRITFDELGHLVTISAETRVSIDVAGPCP